MAKQAVLSYRPDIDGLRAVAVGGVVVYHISPAWLPGGFLGVDIFFVISGFLIGGIVLRNLSEGNFSFKNFYWRRFRRLAPAFLVVMMVTSAVAIFVYSPNELERFGEYLLAALLGVSNMRFIFDGPYELAEASINPLLHTWSLGVEEQFYVLLPAFLVLLGGMRKPRKLLIALGVLFLASFTFSLVIPSVLSEPVNFFGLPSRGWELATGVLLAALAHGNKELVPHRWQTATASLGLAAVAYSFIFLGTLSSGPGWLTLVPVVGGALLIASGPHNAVSQALSGRVPVAIGLISYPLYLWHFPLFAYWELLAGPDALWGKALLALVSVGLAAATYLIIEKPVRFRLKPVQWLPPVSSVAALATSFAVIAIVTNGLPVRVAGMPEVEVVRDGDGPTQWTVGDSGPPILLLGDSQMRTLIPPLSELAGESGYTFASYTEVGCQFLLEVEKARKVDGSVESRCTAEKQNERLEWVNSFGPSIVVLGGRLPLIMTGDRFDNLEGGDEGDFADYIRTPGTTEFDLEISQRDIAAAYRLTVETLIDNGHQVVLMYPIPEAGWHVPDVLARNTVLSGFQWPPDEPLTTSSGRFFDRTRSSFELLDQIQGANLSRVYPHEVFCDSDIPNRCVTHSESDIYYSDEHHPSLAGARLLVHHMWPEITAHSTTQPGTN